VRDGGRAEFLVQRHIATLGSERRRNSGGEYVNASLEAAACFFTENELLCHFYLLLIE